MKPALISVIIPFYNAEAYIEKCLLSVLEQDYPNEIILIDDGSGDSGLLLAQKLLSEHGRDAVVISHPQPLGTSASRNEAISEAHGDWILCIDSDDVFLPGAFQALVAPLEDADYQMVIGDFTVSGKSWNLPSLKLQEGPLIGNKAIMEAYLRWDWYQMPWNKLIRTDFLRDNGIRFTPGAIHGDEIWSVELACLLESMYVVKKPTYDYYVHEGSIVTTVTVARRMESFTAMCADMRIFMQSHKIEYRRFPMRLYERFFRMGVERALEGGREFAIRQYRFQRKAYPRNWLRIASAYGFRTRPLRRNFHLLLPYGIGAKRYIRQEFGV